MVLELTLLTQGVTFDSVKIAIGFRILAKQCTNLQRLKLRGDVPFVFINLVDYAVLPALCELNMSCEINSFLGLDFVPPSYALADTVEVTLQYGVFHEKGAKFWKYKMGSCAMVF